MSDQTQPARTAPIAFFDDSLRDYASGEVTKVLQRLGEGTLTANSEQVFEAVNDQLTVKAEQIIRKFPRLRNKVEAAELVSKFQERLLSKLSAADLADRRHFFGLANKNFVWILRDMLKKRQEGTLVWIDGADTATGPATKVQRQVDLAQVFDYLDTEVDPLDAEVFRLRVLQELTFDQIAATVGIAKSTASAKFNAVQQALMRRFA